jgi:hypothetical protein
MTMTVITMESTRELLLRSSTAAASMSRLRDAIAFVQGEAQLSPALESGMCLAKKITKNIFVEFHEYRSGFLVHLNFISL